MADERHVEVVRRGARALSEWQRAYPTELPDLSGADLSGADLSGAKLGGANLFGTNLRGASLREADLNSADLTWANLSGADLSGAALRVTSLVEADLSGAVAGDTVFVSTTLDGVRGLANLNHLTGSSVDEATLRASPDLPLEFLRGVGLSDELIGLYRSWGGAVRYYSSFISYSRANHDFASRLYDALQASGVRVWLDSHDLPWGARTKRDIFDAIRLHEKLIVVLSEESLESDWVETEVAEALLKERESGRDVLFPVRIDNAIVDSSQAWARDLWNTRNVGDMTEWSDWSTFESQFAERLRWLQSDGTTAP